MDIAADLLLLAGALGAGLFCFVLARRLNRFNDLETGVGGAVALLSAQVDELSKALVQAQATSDGSTATLRDLTTRAESVAQRLELMIASMHDLPEERPQTATSPQTATVQPTASAPPANGTAGAPEGPIFMRHDRAGAERRQ